jgi:uracil-DNA glycosylase family 4
MDAAGPVELDTSITGCRACLRLVAHREEVARTKRAAFADQTYWGRPVPGFGPLDASLLIVGLAPAAHGGNRTGRMFTGDRSGDVLYAALHEIGLASQGTSVSADDGLELYGVRITAPVHCAPPANKPTPAERDSCRPWLVRELELLRPSLRAVVVLGAFGWHAALPGFDEAGWIVPRPKPAFAHGARVTLRPKVAGQTGQACTRCGQIQRSRGDWPRSDPSSSSGVSTSASTTLPPVALRLGCSGLSCVRPRRRQACQHGSRAPARLLIRLGPLSPRALHVHPRTQHRCPLSA